MKFLRLAAIAAAVCLSARSARAADLAPPLLLNTNGVVRNYTNFFTANINALVAALNAAGFAPGGGSGNADTNAANAWSAQQTFLAHVLFGGTNAVAKLSALDAGKQNTDTDLDALAALALTGVVVRTGSGTYALRTLTGDSELVIGDGNGVAGNPLFSISTSLTRDSELTAAIAALSTVYQASDTDLAAFAGLSTTGLIARTGSGTAATRTITGDSEIAVVNGDGVSGNPTLSLGAAIARVAAVAAGYQPLSTVLGRLAGIGLGVAGDVLYRDANGWTNLAKGADGKVLKLVAGLPAWGDDNTSAGGTVATNQDNAFDTPYTQTFNGPVHMNGTTDVAILRIGAASYSGIWQVNQGGSGASNAVQAQKNLGLEPDVDVQTYRLALKQLALALLSSGDVPYRNAAGIVTNAPTTDFGRSLLNGDAAAVRALLGAVYGGGDTMTGPLLVPYIASVSGHTNVGSNQVATLRALAEVEARVSVGGYISSVSPDHEVVGGQLHITNTTGTGPILRQSAAGTNATLAGLTDVTVSSPVPGQSLIYDGTEWGNGIASRMDLADSWVEIFTGIFGGAPTLAASLDEFLSGTANGGSVAMQPTFLGRNGVASISAAAAATYTGGYVYQSATTFAPTNTFHFRTDFVWVLTNSVFARLGLGDAMTSTNNPTDAVQLVGTNGLIYGEACQGGFANRSQTATGFQCSSNTFYVGKVFVTNDVAWFRLYTNRTQLAWESSVNSNVPTVTQLVGPGVLAMSTGSDSTNKILFGVDTLGFRYSVQ